MKYNHYVFYRCVTVIGLLALMFFNCSQMSIISQCAEDDNLCLEKPTNTPLKKKPVDILLVLDNSPKGKKLNPQVTDNLNQLLNCIEPLDWRVGLIAGAKSKNHPLGKLIDVEKPQPLSSETEIALKKESTLTENQVPIKEEKEIMETESTHPLTADKFISADTKNYKQVFADTVSLSSGCDKPPFCHKGKRKPLSALMAFMQNTEEKELFLRESAYLAVVVVSSSDEKRGFFSGPKVSSQEVLSAISLDYSSEQWTAFSVTDAEQADDCIRTAGDFKRTGMNVLAKTGDIVGMVTMQPLIILGSATLAYHANKKSSPASQISQLAKSGGGQTFDICKPFFGRAVAYSILRSVGRESQFPKKCKQFDKSQVADLLP